MRTILPLLLPVLFAAALTGCRTGSDPAFASWDQVILNAPPGGRETGLTENSPYSLRRISSDLERHRRLVAELEALDREFLWIRSRFDETPGAIEEQNKQLTLLLFRFIQVRDAFHDLLHYYQTQDPDAEDSKIRGAVLGMSSWLHLSYADARFAALFAGQTSTLHILNAAHPELEIESGTYSRLRRNLAERDQLELLDLGWHLYRKELQSPDSPLNKLGQSDPVFAEILASFARLMTDTRIHIGYLELEEIQGLPDLKDVSFNHRMDRLILGAEKLTGKSMDSTRSVVFTHVARIKTPGYHLAEVKAEQVAEIQDLLQPGDILLTYTAGYMSDIFLPGAFKHGITYIGSVAERRQAGLTDAYLSELAVSNMQRKQLQERVRRENTADGRPADVVEAVAEGVIFNSLEHLLHTHINRMLVLRPVLTPEEKQQQLGTLFQYVGAPYDFKFDFLDDSQQCCTELVYRTLNTKGDLRFPLSKLKGRWVLDADGMARYALRHPERLQPLLLVDTSDTFEAVLLRGEEMNKRLRERLPSAD